MKKILAICLCVMLCGQNVCAMPVKAVLKFIFEDYISNRR